MKKKNSCYINFYDIHFFNINILIGFFYNMKENNKMMYNIINIYSFDPK